MPACCWRGCKGAGVSMPYTSGFASAFFCQPFLKFELQRDPCWDLHTVREKEGEKRLNSYAHAPGVPSDFPSQRDRFKKRPLFTQHLSKHCGFAFRLQWRGGYCGCLLKNKSVMRAEIDPRCRRSRRSGVGPDVPLTQHHRS